MSCHMMNMYLSNVLLPPSDLASYHVVIIKPDAVADGQVQTIKTKV